MIIPDFDTYRRAARNINDVTAWVSLHIPEFVGIGLADSQFLRPVKTLPWRCRSAFSPTPELREQLLSPLSIPGIFHIGGAETFACHSTELVCDVTVSQWPCLASFVISAYMLNLEAPSSNFVGVTDVQEMIVGAFPRLTLDALHHIHAMQNLTGLELNKWLRQFMVPGVPDEVLTLPRM